MKDIEEMQAKGRKEERFHVLTVYSRGWDSVQREFPEFVAVLLSLANETRRRLNAHQDQKFLHSNHGCSFRNTYLYNGQTAGGF